MKRTQLAAALTIALALVLSACGGSETPDLSQVEAVNTSAAATAIISITQTAAAMPPTSTPEPPTATPTEAPPTPTETAVVEASGEASATPGSIFSPTPGGDAASQASATPGLPPVIGAPPSATPGGSSGNCTYSASFETETVPDGTQYFFGKPFTKTWRVKNTGTCTWDGSVNLIWVGSETDGKPSEVLMGAQAVNAIITTNVAPGEYLDVSIDLVTPSEVGKYRVYFKFRSSSAIFGIGGNGNLWVEIIAYDPDIGPTSP